MAKVRALSPHLAALCADNDKIRDAVIEHDVFSSQDLLNLGVDSLQAGKRLGLSEDTMPAFTNLFSITRSRADGTDEVRKEQMLDVLNSEGQLIMRRTREDVHLSGFWHRVVHVWVACPSTRRVLLGQRGMGKDMDANRWGCISGRLPSGELSMNFAVDRVLRDFELAFSPGEQISLAFSLRCSRPIVRGAFAGQTDAAWVDVYIASLDQEVPLERLHVDLLSKQAAKYVSLEELEQALQGQDKEYVIPPTAEYTKKLLYYLRQLEPSARAAALC